MPNSFFIQNMMLLKSTGVEERSSKLSLQKIKRFQRLWRVSLLIQLHIDIISAWREAKRRIIWAMKMVSHEESVIKYLTCKESCIIPQKIALLVSELYRRTKSKSETVSYTQKCFRTVWKRLKLFFYSTYETDDCSSSTLANLRNSARLQEDI